MIVYIDIGNIFYSNFQVYLLTQAEYLSKEMTMSQYQ